MIKKRDARREAKQLWRLCVVNGSLDDGRARDVVSQVIESRHTSGPAVLAYFLRLVRLDLARKTAQVESAVPLDADVRSSVEQSLSRKYGPGITPSFVVDPLLIGGMRVRVGSDVYDGSVKAELDALEMGF
jgi:F-type H+-transporting ATPase subunit delta